MCYLVAKKKSQNGCVAYKTEHGQRLVEIKRELNATVKDYGVQLITISNPSAYGEYEPYLYAKKKKNSLLWLKNCWLDNNLTRFLIFKNRNLLDKLSKSPYNKDVGEKQTDANKDIAQGIMPGYILFLFAP